MSDFDIVIHTLEEKRKSLWEMTKRNLNSEYIGLNIMDDIRLEQIDQLDNAISMWKNRNEPMQNIPTTKT
jgi:hypothetical protein